MTYKTNTALTTIAVTFAIALLVTGSASCSSKEELAAKSAVDCLLTKTIPAEKRTCIYSLHAIGKDAIPVLIDVIDTNLILPNLGLMQPARTFRLGEGHRNQFGGGLAAYMIDMIIYADSLTPLDSLSLPFLLAIDDYVYEQGLLKVDDSLAPTLQDMTQIRKLYHAWWEKNEDKTLAEIRSDSADGDHPLAGSKYSWK